MVALFGLFALFAKANVAGLANTHLTASLLATGMAVVAIRTLDLSEGVWATILDGFATAINVFVTRFADALLFAILLATWWRRTMVVMVMAMAVVLVTVMTSVVGTVATTMVARVTVVASVVRAVMFVARVTSMGTTMMSMLNTVKSTMTSSMAGMPSLAAVILINAIATVIICTVSWASAAILIALGLHHLVMSALLNWLALSINRSHARATHAHLATALFASWVPVVTVAASHINHFVNTTLFNLFASLSHLGVSNITHANLLAIGLAVGIGGRALGASNLVGQILATLDKYFTPIAHRSITWIADAHLLAHTVFAFHLNLGVVTANLNSLTVTVYERVTSLASALLRANSSAVLVISSSFTSSASDLDLFTGSANLDGFAAFIN